MVGKKDGDKEEQRRKALAAVRGLELIARSHPEVILKLDSEGELLGDEATELLNCTVNRRVADDGVAFLGDVVAFTEGWGGDGEPESSPVSARRMAALREVLKRRTALEVDALIQYVALPSGARRGADQNRGSNGSTPRAKAARVGRRDPGAR